MSEEALPAPKRGLRERLKSGLKRGFSKAEYHEGTEDGTWKERAIGGIKQRMAEHQEWKEQKREAREQGAYQGYLAHESVETERTRMKLRKEQQKGYDTTAHPLGERFKERLGITPEQRRKRAEQRDIERDAIAEAKRQGRLEGLKQRARYQAKRKEYTPIRERGRRGSDIFGFGTASKTLFGSEPRGAFSPYGFGFPVSEPKKTKQTRSRREVIIKVQQPYGGGYGRKPSPSKKRSRRRGSTRDPMEKWLIG
jgi:hypothetical protein